ncbi:hypothetical protein N9B82_04970 [Saprospiraceae bacterium]|nr:hypothetical protein [Saprospiraceae bacterium]
MKYKIQIQINSEGQILPLGIDLSDSFILNWNRKGSEFEIELDLSIWPKSPHYIKPAKNEFTCYKKGILRFYGIKELNSFVKLDSISPSIDLDGSFDWGCIFDFKKENEQLKFSTEFTDIRVTCDQFELELND